MSSPFFCLAATVFFSLYVILAWLSWAIPCLLQFAISPLLTLPYVRYFACGISWLGVTCSKCVAFMLPGKIVHGFGQLLAVIFFKIFCEVLLWSVFLDFSCANLPYRMTFSVSTGVPLFPRLWETFQQSIGDLWSSILFESSFYWSTCFALFCLIIGYFALCMNCSVLTDPCTVQCGWVGNWNPS